MPSYPEQLRDPVEKYDCIESELVVALVCAVGTDYAPVQQYLQKMLVEYGYQTNLVKISDLISKFGKVPQFSTASEVRRVRALMNAGNSLCKKSKKKHLWALMAAAEMNRFRRRGRQLKHKTIGRSLPRTAHIVLTLKRPEEVATLRRIYRDGLLLIGVFATEAERLGHLVQMNAPKNDAAELIKRDSEEKDEFGQQTRATFHLADVFVRLRERAYETELQRFFDLIFSSPFIGPTRDEHAMFLAYASSVRSQQLGRQVGAAIANRNGDVLAVGCNEVPRPGGGLYWPGPDDQCDRVLGYDSNDRQRAIIASSLVDELPEKWKSDQPQRKDLERSFRKVLDITEYGRAVHAEMEAILACARSGTSPVGGTLYTTTFPCHNCARHLIAAGIQRVVYIEPYAKSRAEDLHKDAIIVEAKSSDSPGGRFRRKIPFTPFVGVGPRRYFDLFSLDHGRGFELVRKRDGKMVNWSRKRTLVRVPMSPYAYIEREEIAIRELEHSYGRPQKG